MSILTIRDLSPRGALAFDLAELLELLAAELGATRWRVGQLECTGAGAEELYAIERDARCIGGRELLMIARDLVQVIDGEFHGSRNEEPWVRLAAIDSSMWEVETDDAAVLSRVRARFSRVEDVTHHHERR